MNQARPVRGLIAACKHQLSIRELRRRRLRRFGMERAQFIDRGRIAGVNRVKKFFGLSSGGLSPVRGREAP